jgi:hypothetical protein
MQDCYILIAGKLISPAIKKLPACKPDPVSLDKLKMPSFTWDADYSTPLAAYPLIQAGRLQTLVYVALQHARFTRKYHY